MVPCRTDECAQDRPECRLADTHAEFQACTRVRPGTKCIDFQQVEMTMKLESPTQPVSAGRWIAAVPWYTDGYYGLSVRATTDVPPLADHMIRSALVRARSPGGASMAWIER